MALKIERDGLIQAAIDQLPPKQRAVVTLFYTQHLKYREIALVLDCSEGTVASRLNTAIRNLKSILKDL
jgi:RNA polymerase sigma-70 factor (ECF subfamily)